MNWWAVILPPLKFSGYGIYTQWHLKPELQLFDVHTLPQNLVDHHMWLNKIRNYASAILAVETIFLRHLITQFINYNC